jgi:hypothetical protein
VVGGPDAIHELRADVAEFGTLGCASMTREPSQSGDVVDRGQLTLWWLTRTGGPTFKLICADDPNAMAPRSGSLAYIRESTLG